MYYYVIRLHPVEGKKYLSALSTEWTQFKHKARTFVEHEKAQQAARTYFGGDPDVRVVKEGI